MTLRKTTEKLYKNLNFTHRVHEKQCELLSLGTFIIRLVSVILICTILFLQFWQLLNTPTGTLMVWSVALTVIEVGVTFFQLNFNYDKLLDQHRNTAKSLLAVKNHFIIAMTDNITKKQLEEYVDEFNEIYSNAPQTNKIAKWLANREDRK
ncbi:MAG: SLATT domain-containing protein [Candidatus Saccharimonadales bacterium]